MTLPPSGGTEHDPPAELPSRAETRRAETGRRPRRRRRGAGSAVLSAVRETVIVVVVALALSLLVKTLLIQAFYIPSVSMENTLLVGDRVIVSKLTPGPLALHRGQVIVFTDPNDWLEPPASTAQPGPVRRLLIFVGLLPSDSGNHLIKRVIGLPGDHVVCCDSKGRVSVNGAALNEPYLYPGDVPSEKTFDIRVPADKLWVMGDHRQQSEDSRYKGFVPMKNVTGRAVAVVWPLRRTSWLSPPDSTFGTVPAAAARATSAP